MGATVEWRKALRSGRHTCMGVIVNYAKEVEQCPLP